MIPVAPILVQVESSFWRKASACVREQFSHQTNACMRRGYTLPKPIFVILAYSINASFIMKGNSHLSRGVECIATGARKSNL
jgi:hypothetical protein